MKKSSAGFASVFIILGTILVLSVLVGAIYLAKNQNKHNLNQTARQSTSSSETKQQERNRTFSINKESLVGIWQNDFMKTAGWGDRYQFYKSGKYAHIMAVGLCANKDKGEVGSWKLQGNKLLLTTNKKITLSGGTLVKSAGSCTSPTMITGGKEKIQTIANPQVVEMDLSTRQPNPDEPNYYFSLLFGRNPYWKFESDKLKDNPPFTNLSLSNCDLDQDPCI